jgi:hypothetical protein
VAPLSKDFFELAQLERENWEILEDLSDFDRTLADDQPADLLGGLDQAVELLIVGDANDIEFINNREWQEYLVFVKEREHLIRKLHSPRR